MYVESSVLAKAQTCRVPSITETHTQFPDALVADPHSTIVGMVRTAGNKLEWPANIGKTGCKRVKGKEEDP